MTAIVACAGRWCAADNCMLRVEWLGCRHSQPGRLHTCLAADLAVRLVGNKPVRSQLQQLDLQPCGAGGPAAAVNLAPTCHQRDARQALPQGGRAGGVPAVVDAQGFSSKRAIVSSASTACEPWSSKAHLERPKHRQPAMCWVCSRGCGLQVPSSRKCMSCNTGAGKGRARGIAAVGQRIRLGVQGTDALDPGQPSAHRWRGLHAGSGCLLHRQGCVLSPASAKLPG